MSSSTRRRACAASRPPRPAIRSRVLVVGRVDEAAYCADAIDGDVCQAGVFLDHELVRRVVDAIDLVVRHVAVDPLDFRPELPECSQRNERSLADLCFGHPAGAWDVTFDNKLRHSALDGLER